MYEEFYGLRAKPFALSPDPRFLYLSKGHSRAMAYLEYGIQQEEGFIVITGEIGAGKTTIAGSLLENLDERSLVAANLVSTQLDADDLLHSVCLAFGIRDVPLEKAGQLGKLEEFLSETADAGKRALLVVDEVQNLTPRALEVLRMLSNFQHEDKPLLQSFLIGQPEFRRVLNSEEMQQLRQRVIANYHLGPMDPKDTRSYVEYRLTRAGWQRDPGFAEDVWPVIYRYSGGIPRKVNTFCDRMLLFGFLDGLRSIGREEAERVLAELEAEMGFGMHQGEANVLPADASPAEVANLFKEMQELNKRFDRMERLLLFVYRQNQKILATSGTDPMQGAEPGSDRGEQDAETGL